VVEEESSSFREELASLTEEDAARISGGICTFLGSFFLLRSMTFCVALAAAVTILLARHCIGYF
jgi:hypothetical protein